MEDGPPNLLAAENAAEHFARFGSFSRVFSGTRADLWRLALDPTNFSRPCVTDGTSGAQQLQHVMSFAYRYMNMLLQD